MPSKRRRKGLNLNLEHEKDYNIRLKNKQAAVPLFSKNNSDFSIPYIPILMYNVRELNYSNRIT